VGTPLVPFRVGVVTEAANGSIHNPCAAAPSPPPTALPPIVCSIGLNASATTTNETASIFLQHTLTTVAAALHYAEFDAFALVAPQGQTYGLTLTCAVGGQAIPPLLPFSVRLEGCRAGQESVSVACVTCGGGNFSLGGMGARCTGCPPAGAVCTEGILTLLPHYFRPAAQAGQPLGPDTELHPCYNSEACTLAYNTSVAIYGCSPGYTGPLCGVCDAAANYALFGDACDVCWDPSASAFFLAVVFFVVLGLLTHMALYGEVYNNYPDDAIILRITLGYLQGIGSLRVFVAGSTQAYANVMGWTEVLSASPLSVGALQCLLRLSYLTQYAGTVLLPVLASAIVVVIFLVGTTARSVRCRQRVAAAPAAPASGTPPRGNSCCWVDTNALAIKLAAWFASKRHISTLLFVLFLAYMPITSASLRVLDCMPPIGGVQYLRSNLAVECGVGEHAAARVLAYIALLLVGIGFPAGLAWLLGTARKEQLLDTAFHATWGFLFDGYRTPTRKLVQLPGSDAGGSGEAAGASAAKVAPAAPKLPVLTAAAAVPSRRDVRQRRRSSILPDRLMQTWVVEGDSRVWWEAAVLCRKAGVVLLAVLVTNPYMQCVGATLWFFGAILLQLKYAPYTKTKFNRLELATLTASFVTAVISAALLQFNVDVAAADLHPPSAMTPIEWAVTIALVFINMGMFLTLGFLWLRVQWTRARALVHHIPRPRSLSWARGRSSTSGHVPDTTAGGGGGGGEVSASEWGGDGSGVVTTANPLRTDSTGGTDAGAAAAVSAPLPAPSRRVMFTPAGLDTTGGGGDSTAAGAGSNAPTATASAVASLAPRRGSRVALPPASPTITAGLPGFATPAALAPRAPARRS